MSLHRTFNTLKKIDILCLVCFEIEKADNGTQPKECGNTIAPRFRHC